MENENQQTDEWFMDKLGRFSASDAKTIATAGVGLKTLAYRKAIEHILCDRKETAKTDAMERGNLLEPEAIAKYEEVYGVTVEKVGFLISEGYPEHAGASPDGLDGEWNLEVKCMEKENHMIAFLYDYVKPEHYAQQMMQMWVDGKRRSRYVIYNPDLPEVLQFKVIEIEYDEDYVKKIINGIEKGIKIKQQGIDMYQNLVGE